MSNYRDPFFIEEPGYEMPWDYEPEGSFRTRYIDNGRQLVVPTTRGPRKVHRDNIESETYEDGSGPWFHVRRPGYKGVGVNERLDAQRWASAHKRRSSKGGLGVNPNANMLRYKRDFGYCYTPYLIIDGDLGRSHYPQEWAAGLLPIIPLDRFWAWYNGGPRSVMEYNPPDLTVLDPASPEYEQAMEAVRVYLFLLMCWERGAFIGPVETTREFRRLLLAAGYKITGKQVREALDSLVERGWATRAYRGYEIDPRYPNIRMGYYNPRCLVFRARSTYDILKKDLFDADSVPSTLAFLKQLSDTFAPFYKVPNLSPYNTKRTAPMKVLEP